MFVRAQVDYAHRAASSFASGGCGVRKLSAVPVFPRHQELLQNTRSPLGSRLAPARLQATSTSEMRESVRVSPMLLEEPVPAILEDIDTLVLDCDGVLWQGEDLIEGSKEALIKLREAGKQLLFVTNNSSKSRAMYVEKFRKLGIHAEKEEIIGASYAAAAWLKNQNFDKKVFSIGDVGVSLELEELGIEVASAEGAEGGPGCNVDQFKELKVDEDIGAVVVGCDQAFDYRKLCYASVAIQQGAAFVATNADSADSIGGRLMPGAGAMVEAIAAAAATRPTLVAGKPSPWLLQLLRTEFGVDFSRACVVGDRLDTDIQMGVDAGAKLNVLTLSGVSTWADVEAVQEAGEGAVPHVAVPTLSYLVG
uniref:Phosphoglycolate phosphatase n=1 Tax=Pyramimonas obovata TaxID=1411642 RepID=A0A7S0N923_9CHLO